MFGHELCNEAITLAGASVRRLATPQVSSVIAGATSPEQVKANVKAGEWRLTAEEKEEVDAILAATS